MTSGFTWPYLLMRPRGVGRPPQRILIDPYDEPLPLDQRTQATHPGYNKGRIPPNKGRRYPIEILTPREVAAVLDSFPTKRQYAGIRNRAVVAVMYRSGLRVGEALHLRSKDIDAANGAVQVVFGKGQRTRTVGIDRGGLDFIEAWGAERFKYGYPEDAPLFCTANSRLVPSSYVRATIARMGQRAGIKKRVHAHAFRHAFAFELVMEGVPLPIIQVQLGHVWATSTRVYIEHIAPIEVVARIRARIRARTWILQPSVRPGVGRQRILSYKSSLRRHYV
jgi:site-specific recombinase XerD